MEERFAHISENIIQYLWIPDVIALCQAFSPFWPAPNISDQRPDYVWYDLNFWLKWFVYPRCPKAKRPLWQIILDNISSEQLRSHLIAVIVGELQDAYTNPYGSFWINDYDTRIHVYAAFLDSPLQALIRHCHPYGGAVLLELCQKCHVYDMLQLYNSYRVESPCHTLGLCAS